MILMYLINIYWLYLYIVDLIRTVKLSKIIIDKLLYQYDAYHAYSTFFKLFQRQPTTLLLFVSVHVGTRHTSSAFKPWFFVFFKCNLQFNKMKFNNP